MKIKCPGCGRIMYETTDAYDPQKLLTGEMIRLLEPWKGWKWDKFCSGSGAGAINSRIDCTACGALLAPEGKLTLKPEKPKFVCEVCGRAFAVRNALNSHMSVHKKELKKNVE